MKVSIVIPAYNEAATITPTIKAALAQDYHDYEVIVVNNASSDNTAEIASKFPVTLVNEKRKGLLWAREGGFRAAAGDIIANMDADCLPEADWISRGVKFFADPKVVAVTGPYDYWDAKNSFRLTSLYTQKTVYRWINIFFQLPFIRTGAVLIGGNNLIRRSALEKSGGYNTDLTFYGEDTDTAKRVSGCGKVILSPSFIMKTSARRFKEEGVIALESKYIFHFFKQTLKKKVR